MPAPEAHMFEGYQTYLRPELGKLGNIADAADLITSGTCRAWAWLPNTPGDLAQAFGSPERIDLYLAGLNTEQLVILAGCLSYWRHNNVAGVLASGLSTEFVDVPIGNILLSAAEPELKEAFERLAWSLPSIAQDPAILKAKAYRDHAPGEIVHFPVCLARAEPSQPRFFRLVDGMHRAIQLVRNGQGHITVCLVRDH